ncbi:MAG: hypothetical protein J6Z43_08095 [Clostridiales bacterium]|nr:hypothetical protein [Clostridiales bacterium]
MKHKKAKTDKKPTPKTNYDAHREAEVLTKPVIDDFETKKSDFWKNAAIILTLLSIYLMALLYAYDRGLYAVYKIPVNYTNVDIRRFLPLLVSSVGVSVYIGYYIGSLKFDRMHKNNPFKFLRVLWGSAILMTILSQYIKNVVLCIVLSVVIPTIIEVVFYLSKNIKIKEEELTPATYKMKVEDYVADRLLFFYMRPVVAVMIILIIVAPFCGQFIARHKTIYETLKINNRDYVIVSTVGDNAYIEAVEVKDECAIIHTDEYMRISINDHTFKIIEYKKVDID